MRSVVALGLNGAITVLSAALAVPVPYDLTSGPDAPVLDATAPSVQAARDAMRQGAPQSPVQPDVLAALGAQLFREGDREGARSAWNRAAALDPNLPGGDLAIDLASLRELLAASELEQARARLAEMEKRYEKDPHFHLERAEQAMRSGNTAEAERAYLRAYQLGPSLHITSINLARYRESRKEIDAARTLYLEATARAPDSAQAWSHLGAFQYRRGEFDAAFEALARAAKIDARLPNAEVQMARMSARGRDHIGARHWYRRALAADPPNKNRLRAELADSLMQLGLYGEARVAIEAVLATGEDATLAGLLGYIHEREGREAEAERLYRRAIAQAPADAVARNNLAMLLVRQNRNGKEALSLSREAMAASGDSPLVLGTYACAAVLAGDDEADQVLPRAVQLNPADAWLRYCYGLALRKSGRGDAARVQFDAAQILDPGFPRKAEIQEFLRTP